MYAGSISFFIVIQNVFHLFFFQEIYQKNYAYLQPIVVMSILFGLWGMAMTKKSFEQVQKNHYISGKVAVLQFVLFVTKLENFIARVIISSGALPCKYPITSSVFGNCKYKCHELLFLLKKIYFNKCNFIIIDLQ